MQKRKLLTAYALILLLLICLGIAYLMSMEHDAPEIVVPPLPRYLTENSRIDVLLFDQSSGVKSVEIIMEVGGLKFPVLHEEYADRQNSRHLRFGLQPPDLPDHLEKNGNIEGLLHIQVSDHSTAHWWRGNSSRLSTGFSLDVTPPQAEITAVSGEIRRGGSAALRFKASEPLREALLRAGDFDFTAFTRDGLNYACVFAFPLELGLEDFRPELVLTDPAGHVSVLPVEITAVPHEYREDNITLSLGFINGKFAEFAMNIPEEKDPLQMFLRVNSQVRAANYAELAAAGRSTARLPLWKNGFMKLPRSVKRGLFGDRRLYIYNGAIIDRQTHKGIDYASYSKDNVPASSSGVVVLAKYLGIHGNMVLVDHGLGVQSLYSHLSLINVAPGQEVERGQVIGQTGTSGMAGGDHLHFEILVGGNSVEPEDWLNRAWCGQLEEIVTLPQAFPD